MTDSTTPSGVSRRDFLKAGVTAGAVAGAGLGGCIMVLVQKPHTAPLLQALAGHGIQAEVFRPIAGACSLQIA